MYTISSKTTTSVKYLLISLLGALLVIGDINGLLTPVHSVYKSIIMPIEIVVPQIAHELYLFLSSIGNIRTQWDEKLACYSKVVQLESELLKLKYLEDENQVLKNQLGIYDDQQVDYIIARVITIGSPEVGTYMKIDKGIADGVKLGDLIVSGNILIGKVVQVTQYTAYVSQLNHLVDQSILAIDTTTKARGIIKSKQGKVYIEDVLTTDTLHVNDQILMWDEKIDLPLLIGTIKEVYKDDAEPTQKALIDIPIKYSDLIYVFVLHINEE